MNILPTAYFGRKVSITVKQPGGSSELTLGALRVVFSVSKKRGENIATLTIYNPNDVTAAEFIPKAIVTIEAGYSDFVGTIYSGEIIEVKRGREDLDRTICIKCRGGASELKKGTFSFSFSYLSYPFFLWYSRSSILYLLESVRKNFSLLYLELIVS